ncbi:MAG: hypothetical protein ACLR7N_09290 [Roseburia hominis]
MNHTENHKTEEKETKRTPIKQRKRRMRFSDLSGSTSGILRRERWWSF